MTGTSKKKKKKKDKQTERNCESAKTECTESLKTICGSFKHENSCKKKRKRKKSVERQDKTPQDSPEFSTECRETDHDDHISKKKKKKHKHRDGAVEKQESASVHFKVDKKVGSHNDKHSDTQKSSYTVSHIKKHKKKKRHEKEEEECVVGSSDSDKKQKKKKRKHERIEESDEDVPEKKPRKDKNICKGDTSGDVLCEELVTSPSVKKHKKKKKKTEEKEKSLHGENETESINTKSADKRNYSSNSKCSVTEAKNDRHCSDSNNINAKKDDKLYFIDRDNASNSSKIVKNDTSIGEWGSSDFGQWSTAEFESSAKQQKFLRLLGAMKGGKNSAEQKYSSGILGEKGKGCAMNKKAENELYDKLESQYETAMSSSLNKPKRSGLGCATFTPLDSKFKIDVSKCRSVKFDDD